MEYKNRLGEFGSGPSNEAVAKYVADAVRAAKENETAEVYEKCLACLDVTWLGAAYSDDMIAQNVKRVSETCARNPKLSAVASVCVYPNFVDTAGIAAGDSNLRICSVAGGFPDAQTFLEVKMLEAAMAIENGADEIDIVMNPGLVLAGKYEEAASEIEIIRGEIGEDVTMKVIIESGVLADTAVIRDASLLAMMAGADFVKSSTGKNATGITPEAAVVMCCAIRDYTAVTGRRVGFKASGGVSGLSDAALIYTIVGTILGHEWLDPSLFRIGSSSLFEKLLAGAGF